MPRSAHGRIHFPSPRARRCAVAGALTLIASALALHADDGDLDPAFHPDSGGVFHFHSGSNGDARTRKLLAAPDGASVMLVELNPDAATGLDGWRRVTATGASSTCLIGSGTLSTFKLAGGNFDRLGRLVVVGNSNDPDPWQIVVARYLYPACTPDPSFDGNGLAGYLGSGGYFPLAAGVVERSTPPGGAITFHFLYVAATVQDSPTDVVLLRIWDDGALDTDWGGGDGWVRQGFSGFRSYASDIELDSDRRLVVVADLQDWSAGCDNGFCNDIGVTRFNGDGSLDESFDGNGVKRVSFDLIPDGRDIVRDVAVRSDGAIALVGDVEGSSVFHMGIAVLREDGQYDSQFDDNGQRLVDLSGYDATYGWGAVYQSDNRLVVVGSARTSVLFPYLDDSFAARLLPGGQFDGSFGSGGASLLAVDLISNANDRALALALEGGRAIVGGEAVRSGGGLDAYVLRLENRLIFRDGVETGSLFYW